MSADFRRNIVRQLPDNRPGLAQRLKYLLRQSQRGNQLFVVLSGSGVYQSARRGVGVLVQHFACQAVSKVLRHHKEVRHPRKSPVHLVVIQLVHRVEGLKLYSRTPVQFRKRYKFVHFVDVVGGALVTVGKTRQNALLSAHKHVIHAPRVYCHAANFAVPGNCRAQTVFHFGKQRLDVPHKSVVALLHSVGETVHFVKLNFSVGVSVAYDMPTAGRAYVHCKIVFHIIIIHPSADVKQGCKLTFFVS